MEKALLPEAFNLDLGHAADSHIGCFGYENDVPG